MSSLTYGVAFDIPASWTVQRRGTVMVAHRDGCTITLREVPGLFKNATPVAFTYVFSSSASQDLNLTVAFTDIADEFESFSININSLSRF